MKAFHWLPFLLIPAAGIAQSKSSKFDFKLGTEYELPRKTTDLAFIGNEKDGIVNLSIKKEELMMVRFNTKSLDKTMEQQIDLPEATRNFVSETVIDFNNNNYYWVHSDWDKSSETETLYYDKIDVTKGKIASTNNKMFESSKIAGASMMARGFYRFKATDKYDFEYDAERKKLLVTYRLIPESRNDKKNFDRIGFQVFDENMKKIWGSEFTMPYTEAVMDNADFSVDSKGNAYLLAKVYSSDARREREKGTDKPGYHFEVLKFSKDSKKMISIPVSVDDHYVKEATLTENAMHDMIIACTYSKRSKGNGTDGVFLAVINSENKLSKFKNGYYEFPLQELQKFESGRKRRQMDRKDDYEAPNLKVRDVLVESDGSLFMSLEEYRLVVNTYTDSRGSMRTTYTYYYDDILGCKMSAAGEMEWMRKIPKRQRGSSGRGTMSFKLIHDETGYYFLYLDNLKNLNIPEDEEPKLHLDGFGGQVIVTKLSKDGKATKELLFDTREEDIMIFPAEFHRISGKQFIGRAKLKRNLFQPLVITSR